jgi:hypothetical protein
MAGLIGPQQRQDYAVMGDTTNVAARLMSAAKAGTVLVGEETWRATRHVVGYRELAPVLVKGKQKSLAVWEAVEVLHAPKSRPLGTARLVGRVEELGALAGNWQRVVRERRPHLVSVLGEPGIGKSRLVAEFEKRFCEEALVLRGRCLPYGEALGYGALTMLLKQAAGITADTSPDSARLQLDAAVKDAVSLDSTVGGEGDGQEISQHLALLSGLDQAQDRSAQPPSQGMVHASLRRFFEALARQKPLCLSFEDIHWADDALLDAIEYIAARTKDVPLMLMTQARPQLLEKRPAWPRGVRAFTSLPLEALDANSACELVRALCCERKLSDKVVQQIGLGAGGNPLFAEELVAMVAERSDHTGVPSAIKALIAARLDTLSPGERDLLQLASVFGKVFWTGGLANLGFGLHDQLEQRLESLEQKDLLRSQPRSQLRGEREFIFKHDLIRDVAYETLPRSRRKVLHGQVCDWLARAAGARVEDYADHLAYHALQAEQEGRALDYLDKAAERAYRAALYPQSASLLLQATAIAERLHREERLVEWRTRRGNALFQSGKWSDARTEFEAALALLGEEQSLRRGEVLVALAETYFWLQQEAKQRQYAEESLRVAEEIGNDQLTSMAFMGMAVAENLGGNPESAVTLIRQAINQIHGTRLRRFSNLPGVLLYYTGENKQAIEMSRSVLQFALEINDVPALTQNQSGLALALASSGQYQQAERAHVEARRIAEKYEIPNLRARAVAISAGYHLDLYDYAVHEAIAEEARELARAAKFGGAICSAGIDLLLNFARRGEIARADALVEEVSHAVQTAAGWHGWVWRIRLAQARAEIAWAHGQWAEAERWANEAIAQSQPNRRPKYKALGLWTRARALEKTGRRNEAFEDLTAALKLARHLEDPALELRLLATWLEVEGSDQLLAEARAAAKRIRVELTEPRLCSCFENAAPVRQFKLLADGVR